MGKISTQPDIHRLTVTIHEQIINHRVTGSTDIHAAIDTYRLTVTIHEQIINHRVTGSTDIYRSTRGQIHTVR